MPADDPAEIRRTLNHWNAARHGWSRFQASNRRAAERIARRHPDTDPEDNQS
ncbi:hypothetical protein OIE75_29655 [Streptomyces sp. NBC_01723]|uniref:hypothetical protein n=1 Tax=Streptomyces sp. NBC_01723 TaxID=2975921 RepID=UPI002E31A77E|nr:hypothetical protein [Streptomyces sp. NBC_01723]